MSLSSCAAEITKLCGYTFTDQTLLSRALTHPSATASRKKQLNSYERLEFLGDSVLGCIIANELYQRFPKMDEGQLTRAKIALVSGKMLSTVGLELGLDRFIVWGESELGTGTRGLQAAVENVFEAVVGALYLDGGEQAARAFVLATLGDRMVESLSRPATSPKSLIQEIIQRDESVAPVYKIVDLEGPAHSPTFVAEVSVRDEVVGRGQGSSKKEAESAAARDALIRLGHVKPGDLQGAEVTN